MPLRDQSKRSIISLSSQPIHKGTFLVKDQLAECVLLKRAQRLLLVPTSHQYPFSTQFLCTAHSSECVELDSHEADRKTQN